MRHNNVVRQAIRTWLDGSGLEAIDREVELLAATVGAGEVEALDRSALLAAWRTAFEIAARRAPLVLVFEDLHWSSDSLLDLFEFVMQSRGELPLLMIALTRPELLDRRPAWGGGRRSYVSIELEPLSDPDTAELVEGLLERRAPDLVDRVVRHAEGNPFFAGELVRSVMERPESDHLPDTVQATVLARLDLLVPEERRTIQLGSVFGRGFRLAGIRALEPELTGLGAVAERLIEKDLVRTAGGDTYTFRHILIREVAYQTLTRSERARLHEAAAAWLEGLAGQGEDGLAELIAYHYREAAIIASAQRPDETDTERVRQKAVDWLRRAAEVAAAGAATLEGSRHLRSAIELASPVNLPDLYQRLGDLGDMGEVSAEAYRSALRLCREQGRSPTQELQILSGLLGILMRFQGSVANRPSEQAMVDLRGQAHALAERVTDQRTLATYLAADAGFPFWLRGLDRFATPAEIAAANASAQRALEIGRRLDDPNLQSWALDALSGVGQIADNWRRSLESAEVRLSLRARLNMLERLDAYGMVAWSTALLGELEQADRVTAEALAQVQPGQAPGATLHVVAWRTYVLTLLGRWDEALGMAERAHQLWDDLGRPSTGFALHGFMAAIDIARARQDQQLLDLYGGAHEAITSAYPEGTHFRHWQGYGRDLTLVMRAVEHFNLGLMLRVERLERGLSRLLDQDLLLPAATGTIIADYSGAHEFPLLQAQAERALGRAERNADWLQQSVDRFVRVGAVPYAARVRCERALITGDHAEMATGLKILEGLGDVEQIGRFERLQVG